MPEPTITADEAATRVEQHIRDVAAALPGARLEVFRESHISPCTAPNGGGPLVRVFAARSYWVRDIPQERNPETFDTALNHWTSNGYTVLTDSLPAGPVRPGPGPRLHRPHPPVRPRRPGHPLPRRELPLRLARRHPRPETAAKR
jgi:hypothetical protein